VPEVRDGPQLAAVASPDDPYCDLLLGDLPLVDARERPWVALCAVTSSDGVTAVEGSSRGIGGDADRIAMRRIRRGADAVLVGAATVRAEGYDAPMTRAEDIDWRLAQGLQARAALVIVSRTLDLGPFGGGVQGTRVIVLTADPARPAPQVLQRRLEANGSSLEVIDAGRGGRLDWPSALERLREAGLRRVSCEGGPSVNGQLLAHGLVDEVFLTVAPRILGVGPATLAGYAGTRPVGDRLRLRSVAQVGDELLLRYELPSAR
jgi:riboflavin biosynthesis pyrimidine reductase